MDNAGNRVSDTTATSAPAQLISVGGGKGGVGKSIISSNLAVTCAQMGKRVVLADLDLGAANQHLLFGVQRPKAGVQALLDGEVSNLADALSPTELPNLSLLAGTGAVLGAANITHAEKKSLLRKLRALPADLVIIDVGAGVGYNALDFFELGTQKLVVTTAQVTAIHDAYSFMKSAILRMLRRHVDRAIEAALLEPAFLSAEGEKVVDLLARLREQRPELAQKVQVLLSHYGGYLIGNNLPDPRQAGIFTSVSKMIREYLGVDLPVLGWLRASVRVNESVNSRRPMMLSGPSEEGRVFRHMAETLLTEGPLLEEYDLDVVLESDGSTTGLRTAG